MPRRIALVAFGLAACARHGDPETGSIREAIVGGTPSGDDQDEVVMLVQIDPVANRRVGICTGALIAPRLVLTARHCVANVDDGLLACDADGSAIRGGRIAGDVDAGRIFVFTGKNRPDLIGLAPPDLDTTRWTPAGHGVDVIDDQAKSLCNHDLALVLLQDPITTVPLATLRLDSDAAAGEKLVTVGWGVTSAEDEPKVRQQRRDVTVVRVGPDASIPTLTPSELLFDESICLGDSGGPIFSERTNAIVAVVSRGGNGEDPTASYASTCIQADNIGTKLSPFKPLFMDAFSRAGASPKLEPPADDGGCSASPRGARDDGRAPLLFSSIACVAAFGLARRRTRRQSRSLGNFR